MRLKRSDRKQGMYCTSLKNSKHHEQTRTHTQTHTAVNHVLQFVLPVVVVPQDERDCEIFHLIIDFKTHETRTNETRIHHPHRHQHHQIRSETYCYNIVDTYMHMWCIQYNEHVQNECE